MKKIILSSLIAVSVMLGANADDRMCPDLTVQTSIPNLASGIKIGLQSVGNTDVVFSSILKQYNKVDNVDLYYTEETLNALGTTPVFNSLMLLKFKSTSTRANPALEQEYTRLLNTITPDNKNWCGEMMNEEIRSAFFNGAKL